MIDDDTKKKLTPVYAGLLAFFPDALREVAQASQVGAAQHAPGQPMHLKPGRTVDAHLDSAARHLLDQTGTSGALDTDGVRHLAKAAWHCLAALQLELAAVATALAPSGGCGPGVKPVVQQDDAWTAMGTPMRVSWLGPDSLHREGQELSSEQADELRKCKTCWSFNVAYAHIYKHQTTNNIVNLTNKLLRRMYNDGVTVWNQVTASVIPAPATKLPAEPITQQVDAWAATGTPMRVFWCAQEKDLTASEADALRRWRTGRSGSWSPANKDLPKRPISVRKLILHMRKDGVTDWSQVIPKSR